MLKERFINNLVENGYIEDYIKFYRTLLFKFDNSYVFVDKYERKIFTTYKISRFVFDRFYLARKVNSYCTIFLPMEIPLETLQYYNPYQIFLSTIYSNDEYLLQTEQKFSTYAKILIEKYGYRFINDKIKLSENIIILKNGKNIESIVLVNKARGIQKINIISPNVMERNFKNKITIFGNENFNIKILFNNINKKHIDNIITTIVQI